MKSKSKFRLMLTNQEKQQLRRNNVHISDLPNYALDELEVLMEITYERAREIGALIEFQSIKTIGIKFAEDLISLGYYSINELKGKNPAKLTEEFELLKGYWIDPCVEDQFRLVVYHANTYDKNKNWWDFTEERKKFRHENGYPTSRPVKPWYEMKSAILTVLFVLVSFVAFSQNCEIVVNIDGFRTDNGKCLLSLFNNKKGFPSNPDKAVYITYGRIQNRKLTLLIKDIAIGEYAIAVVHDENDNNKLDTNFLGMPKEGVGVSNNAKSMMGPPKYEDAKFQLNKEGLVTNIRIKYL